MRPTTWVVAAEEPEMAAKIVQPMTLTCSSRLGSSAAHGESPLNSDGDSRVRNRISPIRMNSGSASSSCVVRMFHAYWAKSLSSGMSRNSARRIVPVTASVQPIHRPPARKANSTTNMVTTMISTAGYASRRASFGDRTGTHVEILERQAEGGLKEAGHDLHRQKHDAEAHEGLRDPDQRAARHRGLAGVEAAPGEVGHRPGKVAAEARPQGREHRLHPTARRRRHAGQHQRDAEVATRPQS